MALNIITAKFCSGSNQTWTDEAWQYDYGQVLRLEGLELPDAYEVHFSNTPMSGETITQIGGADGVSVPDQYFTTGETVYAWVYLHEGEDDGETVYMVTIPVKKRPQPSDDEPTPVQQDAITEAIAALNAAVTDAETAITHYPKIEGDYWYVWDVSEGEYVSTGIKAVGEDGTSVTASVSTITGGHRVTLTDADGEHTFDVMDGVNGQPGISPTITVTDITGGHRITITDAEGTQTVDVMNGQPGAPGYSPTVTVTEITGGHRVTITDAQGAHTFDVMDGQGGSVTVDDALSTTSENPVQNKVINSALNGLVPKSATDAEIGSTTKIKNYGDLLKLSYSNSQGGVDVQLEGNNLLIYAEEGNSQNLLNFGANGTSIRNVVTPTSAGDAVSKSYVDTNVGAKADISDLAPAYSTSGTYAVGDYVTYTGNVYRCTTAITTAEAWTAAHWTQVAIGTELTQYNEDLSELSSSIAPVESSATATAAHAVGELFLVGETLMVALSAIAIGDTITTDGATPNAAVTTLSAKMIKDVQVNGSSILNNGVANVPKGSDGVLGALSTDGNYGISANANGRVYIVKSNSTAIKNGSHNYCPVVPSYQHESTFYGLAKAASDTTQSASSNAVGTYTDAAKIAIQKMLGIYEAPWELIADATSTEDAGNFTVETDINGQPFQLKKGIVYVEAPHTTTGTRDYIAASWRGVNSGGEESTLIFPNIQWVGATASTLFYYEFDCNGVTPQRTSAIAASGFGSTASYTQTANYINANPASYLKRFNLLQYNNNSSRIPSGTRIRIYGQRYVQ